MATGDHRSTAEAVARGAGLEHWEAGLLPADKARLVAELRAQGRVVAMAGDGVNDAPALAEADVGIAMGTGTDIAIESAGITLMKGDLGALARARALSRAVMRNIRQNLILAFVYNLAGVPIAAGVLYPAFGLLLSPAIAALAMSLSSVSVIGNALRLRQRAAVAAGRATVRGQCSRIYLIRSSTVIWSSVVCASSDGRCAPRKTLCAAMSSHFDP